MEKLKRYKTNASLKKELKQIIKYLDNYEIRVVVYTSDECCNEYSHDLEVQVYENEEYIDALPHTCIRAKEIEFFKGLEMARKQLAPDKKKLVKYLSSHFDNVVVGEDYTQ